MKNLPPISLFILIFIVFGGNIAQAFTVELEGSSATGIQGLNIDGTSYNVVFEFVQADTANTVACAPGVPCDIFFGNMDAAAAAMDAINAAMNSWTPFPTTVGSSPNTRNDYFVPWDVSGGNVSVTSAQAIQLSNTWFRNAADFSLDDTDMIQFARFSVVPIPASAWLFGSALGILGWVRRRMMKAATR